jgi:hypothetical protein
LSRKTVKVLDVVVPTSLIELFEEKSVEEESVEEALEVLAVVRRFFKIFCIRF